MLALDFTWNNWWQSSVIRFSEDLHLTTENLTGTLRCRRHKINSCTLTHFHNLVQWGWRPNCSRLKSTKNSKAHKTNSFLPPSTAQIDDLRMCRHYVQSIIISLEIHTSLLLNAAAYSNEAVNQKWFINRRRKQMVAIKARESTLRVTKSIKDFHLIIRSENERTDAKTKHKLI